MEPGLLRHRITIQQSSRACDAMGEAIETWTTYATVWAAIMPMRGRELFSAQAANSEATVKFLIRYKNGIQPKWRITHGDAVYLILEIIDPNMMHKELQILCKEIPQSAT